MKFNLIPPGKFLMGSPESEIGRYDDEMQHEVKITKLFYLSAHEVTPRSGAAGVPEPSCLLLVLMAWPGLLAWRCR
jgi:hypothetical protein